MTHMASLRADSRFVPSQWETSLQSNAVSHWLGPILESALITRPQRVKLRASVLPIMRTQLVWHFNAKQYLKYTYEIDVTAHFDSHRADHNDRNTSVRAVLTEKIFRYEWFQIDGLVQERRNSIALAMELRLTCTNPSKYCSLDCIAHCEWPHTTSWHIMKPLFSRKSGNNGTHCIIYSIVMELRHLDKDWLPIHAWIISMA